MNCVADVGFVMPSKISKAIIKDAVICGGGEDSRCAPRGEYEINHDRDCVGLCHCASRETFVLSLDAYFLHLSEGRIALAA